MPPGSTDFLEVVPNFVLGDLLRFAAWVVVAVVLPGHVLRRTFGLRPVAASERCAITCVLGVLATSLLYYLLALRGLQGWHPPLVVLLAAAAGLYVAFDVRNRLSRKRERRAARGGQSHFRGLRRENRDSPRERLPWSAWKAHHAAGLLAIIIIVALAAVHVSQVASLVEFDSQGVRLYGALFSDKMTNMSPCAALIDGVPPAALRFSGYVFPSHYFPHLFVAASDRAAGVDYVDGFWLYAAALGIVVQSLAVLAFCRRFLRSGWFASAALVLFGLTRFTSEARPLDLSLAFGLLGIVAVDRYACAGRRRWAALAVCLFAAMPLYEVFTATAALGGLALWAVAPAVQGLRRLWRGRQGEGGRHQGTAREQYAVEVPPVALARRQIALRLPVALLACLGTFLAVRLLYLGAEIKSPPELIGRNSYRDSYRHEWMDLLRESEGKHLVLTTVYQWKRGKPATHRPSLLQRAAGELLYDLGFAVYFLMRFVNLAIFGVVGVFVALGRNRSRSRTGWAAIASICLLGFGVPCVLSWGHTVGDRFYETPNIYRLTDCAYLLLLLVGVPALFRAIAQWRRLRWWVPLGLAGWQFWVLAAAAVSPTTFYHHVDFDRLKALRFLRAEVPRGQVVLHPWVDDLIRDARRPEDVAWVYKRHFTFGSNLAGCQMFYEGRADHLFINGAVAADEVFKREQLREAFYSEPTPEVIRSVVEEGNVDWVVCDDENPAPPCITSRWQLVHATGTVRIYYRGDRSSRGWRSRSWPAIDAQEANPQAAVPAAAKRVPWTF